MADVEPLRPITLEAADGERWAFRPQTDMTPIESALIAQLFVRMVMTVWKGPVDWRSYAREHRLERHFLTVKPLPIKAPGDILKVSLRDGETIRDLKRVEYIAERDTSIPHDQEIQGANGWRKGYRLVLLEGMPVPEGFVPATPENVARILGTGMLQNDSTQ